MISSNVGANAAHSSFEPGLRTSRVGSLLNPPSSLLNEAAPIPMKANCHPAQAGTMKNAVVLTVGKKGQRAVGS
jgi:hypothetical protein